MRNNKDVSFHHSRTGITLLVFLEILAWILSAVFTIAWINDPGGNYEPWTVLFGLVGGIAEVRRRGRKNRSPTNETSSKPPSKVPALPISKVVATVTSLPARVNSTAFFATRFGRAFPGVRDVTWYSPRDAVKALSKLFEEPFVYRGEDGEIQTPIWWFRGGNMGVDDFRVIDRETVLLDFKELKIKRLAAVPSNSYYRQFVYIEAEPMLPTGLYPSIHEAHEEAVEIFGYNWEEYGLYKGRHFVTRAQYDDNAAMIGGELVTLGSDVEIRTRYLSPYNLVIAPHGSPINSGDFDDELVSKLNEMLLDHTKVSELQSAVERLPRRSQMYES